MTHVRYEVQYDYLDKLIVLLDLGPWDQHPTITNDAEQVVADLVKHNGLRDYTMLLYIDSEGDLGEIRHQQGRFVGFAPAPRRA